MSNHTNLPFRKAMGGLHTWTGLTFAWLLFFMFVTGTLGYFDSEIDRWMNPEIPAVRVASAQDSSDIAQQYLEKHHPNAEEWYIHFPVDRSTPALRVYWHYPKDSDLPLEAREGSTWLSITTGEPITGRDTGGGQTLYRMHYKLAYLPKTLSELLVGIFTTFMLLALITGIIIHRNIFREFFTFRPNKKRRSWLDFHNLTSVASLPFQLMITYSGLMFYLTTFMPLIVVGSYGLGGDKLKAFIDEVFPREVIEQQHTPQPLPPLKYLVADAEHQWGIGNVYGLEVHWPGDAGAEVHLAGPQQGVKRTRDVLEYDAYGEQIIKPERPELAQMVFFNTMLGLHEGLFAGAATRGLYLLSGLLGTLMIASGLILWTVKRRAKESKREKPSRGFMFVERLNAGVLIGLPIAIAGYFASNRLLPLEMTARAQWEQHLLFIIWLIILIFAAIRPTRRCWIELSILASATFLLLPLINGFTTELHLANTVAAGDWASAGIDLGFIVMGISFALIAIQTSRHWQADTCVKRKSRKPLTQEVTA